MQVILAFTSGQGVKSPINLPKYMRFAVEREKWYTTQRFSKTKELD